MPIHTILDDVLVEVRARLSTAPTNGRFGKLVENHVVDHDDHRSGAVRFSAYLVFFDITASNYPTPPTSVRPSSHTASLLNISVAPFGP